MRIKQRTFFIAVLLFTIFSAVTVYAHPGKTDSNGGHTDRSTGEYHYHHGYPAHNHSDLDEDGIKEYCPYNHDDATDHTNIRGTVTKTSTDSVKPSSPAPGTASGDAKQLFPSSVATDSTADSIAKAEDEAFHLQSLSIAALLLAAFTFFIPALFGDFTFKDSVGVLFYAPISVLFASFIPSYIVAIILSALEVSPNLFYSLCITIVVIVCVYLLRNFKSRPLNQSDSILFITYCEALSLLGSTIITQNISSTSGAGTFFIALFALCVLIWIYYRFRPKKATPKPSSEIPPAPPKEEERVFYMEAANGMTVRVPESKLDSWIEAQERIKNGEKSPELTEQEKKVRDMVLERIYGSKPDSK